MEIYHAGERAGTRHLLTFSRKQILAPKILELNGLVYRNAAPASPLKS
jgi:hypothetical protein